MKVLLSAFACEFDWGGESAVGRNWVRQIARFHDVWVLTRGHGREQAKDDPVGEMFTRVRFIYIDLPPWAHIWMKGQLGVELHYYLWQLIAYFVGRKLHRDIGFDIIHHVTVGKYWMPSFLALLPVPFIWGPVGGGESAPRAFWWSFSVRGKIFELTRDLACKMGEWDPFVRRTARKAKIGLATSEQTAARLRRLGARHVVVHPQFGMTREARESLQLLPLKRRGPFRIISMGRLLPWKGFHLGLRAFAKLQTVYPDCEYWIVNEGLEMKHLKALAKRLGVENKVTFWGGLPTLQDVYSKLAECDVLVHPALHEAFGNVCLEALASGRPVICLDLGGPALQVTDNTGIKVRACTPDQAVADLAAAMFRLATNPLLRMSMASASQRRVEEHFDWDSKGEFMARVYADSVQGVVPLTH
jgi:glycosyltransferase involved in cell wall biosynthesis